MTSTMKMSIKLTERWTHSVWLCPLNKVNCCFQKKKLVEQKCAECNFKCFDDAMMRTHQTTSHGGRKKMKVCQNCSFACTNVWEVTQSYHQPDWYCSNDFSSQMDFHCRSRGHKVKKEEGIPCKKCDYIAENKDDSWVHKKVHIPPEKLFECGDCVWCGDRLDNIRHHIHSQVSPPWLSSLSE